MSSLPSLASDPNLLAAFAVVRANRGAPGVDGETIAAFETTLPTRLPALQSDLLAGTYRPSPVRAFDLPKASGGVRTLGIPTVVDRVVLQAISQVLTPLWEPTFSPFSFAYRPGRSAQDAVAAAQQYLAAGRSWVVDLDIEKFFDRVDHVRLMLRLGQRVHDAALLDLIADFLRSGRQRQNAPFEATSLGLAQGSPLSPLLANIVLDELDQEFTRLGWAFARYSDDCILLAASEQEARSMLDFIAGFLDHRLHLRLHPEKTRVVLPADAAFLGFTYRLSRYGQVQRQVTHQSFNEFRRKVRELARPDPARSFDATVRQVAEFVRGWSTYFGFAQDRTVAAARSFARTRLRECAWQLWRDPAQRRQELIRLGVNEAAAETAAYRLALPHDTVHIPALATAFPNAWFDRFGLGDQIPKPQRRSRAANPAPDPASEDTLRRYLLSPDFLQIRAVLTNALAGNIPATNALDSLVQRLHHTANPTRGPITNG